MFFLNRTLTLRAYLIAGFLGTVIPMCAGYLVFFSNPGACYDSPCALPLLLLTVPVVAAPALTALFALNRQFHRRLPDGWVPTVLVSACAGQAAISVVSIFLASPNIRRIFFTDILFVPQGFFVCFVTVSVLWTALHLLGREITEP